MKEGLRQAISFFGNIVPEEMSRRAKIGIIGTDLLMAYPLSAVLGRSIANGGSPDEVVPLALMVTAYGIFRSIVITAYLEVVADRAGGDQNIKPPKPPQLPPGGSA